MKALLDTHVWLWLLAAPDRIAPAVLDTLQADASVLFLSAASVWEISIKYQLGKLPLPEPPETFIAPRLLRDGIKPLPVQIHHAARVAALPREHGDPFDRLLIAQAQIERATLVTADSMLSRYDVATLWAAR